MSDKPELQITYKAILDYAREGKVLSYSDIAERHGQAAYQARSFLGKHLKRIMQICRDRNWPAIPVIVVRKGEKILTEKRDKFIEDAKVIGYNLQGDDESINAEMFRVFEWARIAPHQLKDEDDINFEDGTNYWLVGAASNGTIDQTDRFVAEGIWKNGDDGKFEDSVNDIKPGDRIAIKSSYVRCHNLTFRNYGKNVSVMRIKAIGTVKSNNGDGITIQVDWKLLSEYRDWYFYVYLKRINKVNIETKDGKSLVKFVFGGADQDLDYWLNQPHLKERYQAPSLLSAEDQTVDEEDQELELYDVSNIISDGCFASEAVIVNALSQLKERKNLILQGPPGTGKSWLARRIAKALVGTSNDSILSDCVRRIQFHPSLSYEDFVRGYRPSSSGDLVLTDGIFLKMAEAALKEPSIDFVLIIEEINRGNTAQIFGEALTLIEGDKRSEDEVIELAYPRSQDERLHLPDNFHIIGTMNIADRSIAIVDFAFRRRFAFVDLKPELGDIWVRWCVEKANFDRNVVKKFSKAIGKLNEEISNDRLLGPQYQIGHSYVTPPDKANIGSSAEWFRQVIQTEIAPLLDEYWYEDSEKAKEQIRKLEESV